MVYDKRDMLSVFGIKKNSSVDGPGLRYAIFAQGCAHKCPGCHNPESQPIDTDCMKCVDVERIVEEILSDPMISGVSFSGGDPFLQPRTCANIVEMSKSRANRNLSFWAWSGWTYEELLEMGDDVNSFLDVLDVLVDGSFEQRLHDVDLLWRGSSNQRVIDLEKTRETGNVFVIDDSFWNVPDKTPKIRLHPPLN